MEDRAFSIDAPGKDATRLIRLTREGAINAQTGHDRALSYPENGGPQPDCVRWKIRRFLPEPAPAHGPALLEPVN
jgi:hypothetical protein